MVTIHDNINRIRKDLERQYNIKKIFHSYPVAIKDIKLPRFILTLRTWSEYSGEFELTKWSKKCPSKLPKGFIIIYHADHKIFEIIYPTINRFFIWEEEKQMKVKDIKTKKTRKRARITVKSLLADVRKKMNKEKVEAVIAIVEEKYKELEAAKGVVRKLQKQINDLEDKDIEEIDTDDYEYEEDEA